MPLSEATVAAGAAPPPHPARAVAAAAASPAPARRQPRHRSLLRIRGALAALAPLHACYIPSLSTGQRVAAWPPPMCDDRHAEPRGPLPGEDSRMRLPLLAL